MRQIDYDLESNSLYLSCAVENLDILLEGIQDDLITAEKAQVFMGTGNLKSHCDAIYFTVRALERMRKDMDAAIEAAYAEGDENHERQN